MSEPSTRMVFCQKLQKQAPGLPAAPYPGDLGTRIFEGISQEAWQLWLGHQTMLINEKRLSMIDPEARDYLQQQMEAFLFGGETDKPAGFIETE